MREEDNVMPASIASKKFVTRKKAFASAHAGGRRSLPLRQE